MLPLMSGEGQKRGIQQENTLKTSSLYISTESERLANIKHTRTLLMVDDINIIFLNDSPLVFAHILTHTHT